MPYFSFLRELAQLDSSVGIIAIELLPVSMHMSRPLPRSTLSEATSITLRHFDFKKCILIAQSYGTTLGLHTLPEVHSALLIEPIPILMHLPDVTLNFLYKVPNHTKERLLWYFSAREPDVARVLHKTLFWQETVLWRGDLFKMPGKMHVALSGADRIVPSRKVWRYLTGRYRDPEEDEGSDGRWDSEDGKVTVTFHESVEHAMMFAERSKRLLLFDAIEQLQGVVEPN